MILDISCNEYIPVIFKEKWYLAKLGKRKMIFFETLYHDLRQTYRDILAALQTYSFEQKIDESKLYFFIFLGKWSKLINNMFFFPFPFPILHITIFFCKYEVYLRFPFKLIGALIKFHHYFMHFYSTP